MINSLISIFAYGFDLFIILIFMNSILGKRREDVPNIAFWGAFFLMEVILFINEYLTAPLSGGLSRPLTVTVSIVTTLGLTFLYHSTLMLRLFVTFSFQILALLGEYAFTEIMYMIRPEMFENITPALYAPMNLGSKVVLFLFTLIISSLFGNAFHFTNKGYHLLLFTTPMASLTIMLFTPLEDINQSNNQTFFLSIFVCLAILNIANYVLLDFSYKQTKELFQLKQIERLSAYQQDKYIQLSSAYKSNRSLIHDTKKHYFVIRKYLENKEYQKLDAYLDIAINDIENTHSEINTGNLVIDSFINNCKNVCDEKRIGFSTDLSVDPHRIPINNYDLCVILGNLLDNAITACTNNSTAKNYIQLTITNNDNDMFYIHMQNTYNSDNRNNRFSASGKTTSEILEHGYGLTNIKKVLENHHGIMNIYCEELFQIDIVLPIIKDEMRLMPPVIRSNR